MHCRKFSAQHCITDSSLLCSEMQTLDFSEKNLLAFLINYRFRLHPAILDGHHFLLKKKKASCPFVISKGFRLI
jgi:hypothetical protein